MNKNKSEKLSAGEVVSELLSGATETTAVNIGMLVDPTIPNGVKAIAFLPQMYYVTKNNMQLKSMQNRINSLDDMIDTMYDAMNEDNYFTCKKIVEKYFNEPELLDEQLQKSITDYVLNNSEDKFYMRIIDFLIYTSSYKLNSSLKMKFSVAYDNISYEMIIGTPRDENYYIGLLTEMSYNKTNIMPSEPFPEDGAVLTDIAVCLIKDCLKLLTVNDCKHYNESTKTIDIFKTKIIKMNKLLEREKFKGATKEELDVVQKIRVWIKDELYTPYSEESLKELEEFESEINIIQKKHVS